MKKKNNAHVYIRNKDFVISGYESAEYMQKVAAYLNYKTEEVGAVFDFNNLDLNMKNIMLEINITDELFKTQNKVKDLEEELKKKEEELYNLKHEFIHIKGNLKQVQDKLDTTGQAYEMVKRKLEKFSNNNSKNGTVED